MGKSSHKKNISVDKDNLHKFKFRKHSKVGAIDAIEDKTFLQDCFVDTGELSILLDTERPECIVLGRTGAGKSALLEMLKDNTDYVISLSPDDLALTYLSNNTALRFFMDLGIHMDLFFQVLWRHIFIVELVKIHFDTTNAIKVSNLISLLRNL